MNSKQVAKILSDAAGAIDNAYALFPKAQRTPAAKALVDQITAAKRTICARAQADFQTAIAAHDLAAADEARKVASYAAGMTPVAADATADDEAIQIIISATAALDKMPQVD